MKAFAQRVWVVPDGYNQTEFNDEERGSILKHMHPILFKEASSRAALINFKIHKYIRNSLKYYRYNVQKLVSEVLCAISAAIMQLPDSVAFSFVAGVDPIIGLYSTFVIGLFAGLLGGRPGMINGAAGALAVIVKPLMADDGDLPELSRSDRLQHVYLAVFICGIVQLIAGIIQIPRLVKLIPRTAMFGFLNGLAVIMFQSQLDAFKMCTSPDVIFGECPDEDKIFMNGSQGSLWLSLLYVALSLVICLGLRRILPEKISGFIPGTLVSVLICAGIEHGIVRTSTSNESLYVRTIEETASFPSQVPVFLWPSTSAGSLHFGKALVVGLWMALVGLIESIMTLQTLNDLDAADVHLKIPFSIKKESEKMILEERASSIDEEIRSEQGELTSNQMEDEQQTPHVNTVNQQPQIMNNSTEEDEEDIVSTSPAAHHNEKGSTNAAITFRKSSLEFSECPPPYSSLHSHPFPPSWESCQEALAQGIANIIGAVLGSMGGCAMVGQTVSNFKNGGRGRLSAAGSGLVMLLFIAVIGPAIKKIPIASLAGVIFVMVVRTFAWPSIYLMRRMPIRDILVIVIVTALAIWTHNLAIAVLAGTAVQACAEMWVRTTQFAVSFAVVRAHSIDNELPQYTHRLAIFVENVELCYATVQPLLEIASRIPLSYLQQVASLNNNVYIPIILSLERSRIGDVSSLLALGELASKIHIRLEEESLTSPAATSSSPLPHLFLTGLNKDSQFVISRWGSELKNLVKVLPNIGSILHERPICCVE